MRDKRGRFKKAENNGILLNINCPSIKKLILYLLIIIVLLPWVAISFKMENF